MILEHSFDVDVPIETAWQVLTDLEVVAPCLPGANLDRVEGEKHHGTIIVKLGSITATFVGIARIIEQDRADHRAVLHAEGRGQRGAGSATATITAHLIERDETTSVEILTDLKLVGKIAQFGRGVLPDLSAKMIDQFVENLQLQLSAESESAATPDADNEPQPVEITFDDIVRPKFVCKIGAVAVGVLFAFLIARKIRS